MWGSRSGACTLQHAETKSKTKVTAFCWYSPCQADDGIIMPTSHIAHHAVLSLKVRTSRHLTCSGCTRTE